MCRSPLMFDDPFRAPAHPVWGDPPRASDFPPADSDISADVVIVGAGFSGLWTAHHLKQLDPRLHIVVLDAAAPGFGASGRNGGWCSALMPMSLATTARSSSRDAAIAMQTSMFETVDLIGDFVAQSRHDCGWAKGGSLHSATNPAHLRRLHEEVSAYREFGFGLADFEVLDERAARVRVNASGTCGAVYTPHCAALNPRELLQALLDSLCDSGVVIHGGTRVRSLAGHSVTAMSSHGEIRATAPWVVRATEGFTRTLSGYRRTLAPIYSFMIATEPLPAESWAEIGWNRRETFADARHMIIYAQRTSDDRIAFGGRGAPYKWASGVSPRFDTHDKVHARLEQTLHELFPVTASASITHRWGGPLGLPRDWFSSVNIDRKTGTVDLGGYVGDGVALSHLAGRTAAHLITGIDDPITRLPWVGHSSRKWEPEPLRFIGINAMLRVPLIADARERRTQRDSSLLRRLIQRFSK